MSKSHSVLVLCLLIYFNCISDSSALKINKVADFSNNNDEFVELQNGDASIPFDDVQTQLVTAKLEINTLRRQLEQNSQKLLEKDDQIAAINCKITKIERSLTEKDQQITTLNNKVQQTIQKVTQQDEQIATLTERVDFNSQKITDIGEAAITDIRVSNVERQQIWKAPGFEDASGYFITGVNNWNTDAYPDHVFRRKIEKKRNGYWSSFF